MNHLSRASGLFFDNAPAEVLKNPQNLWISRWITPTKRAERLMNRGLQTKCRFFIQKKISLFINKLNFASRENIFPRRPIWGLDKSMTACV